MIYVIFAIFSGISWFISNRLKSKFTEYSKIALRTGLSGKEVAEKMLRDNGINDVKVVSAQGFLSDHYHPVKKTVNLSPEVYNGRSVSAAAVSAHECGHAVQHATAYKFLTLRSKLVPVVSVSSKFMQWILLAGILTVQAFPEILLGGIVLFSLTTLFSFITLPVEFDATKRGLAWLSSSGVVTTNIEKEKAQDALKWAALTYVVAALSSLATLFYYIMIYMRRR